MAESLEQLFEKEKRNPWKIRRWLRLEGFSGEIIDLALAEHAQRIKDNERFGYVGGISVLSQSIRKRVKKLTARTEQEISTELGKFKKTAPLYKRIWRKLFGN